MSIFDVKPKFLYPHSRQFPFDSIASDIITELEKRNWRVPGIVVEFDSYGSGEAKYKKVRYIRGQDFKLTFSRKQGMLDSRWSDTAALCSVHISHECLEVFEDESGPKYYLYVGDKWQEDKNWFMNSIKIHAKLNKEPRRYLLYLGNHTGENGVRSSMLINTTDCDREYAAMDNEPQSISLDETFERIIGWLKANVLDNILNNPEPTLVEETHEKLVPYNGPWERIFSICPSSDLDRIRKGIENPEQLPPEDRYASFGSFPRLVPLWVRAKTNLSKVARDEFCWCDTNQRITNENGKQKISCHIISELVSHFPCSKLVSIKLKYANNVYVIDDAEFDETKQKLSKKIKPRIRLTNDELSKAFVARAATIVPINEYKGGYQKPVVLIGRELDFDEIEWIED
ncbi:MAG: hypothetical protein J6J36_05370 [Clostridia bacterium]|nr:hypothetical protein [Clostridia bacterium]